MLNRLFQTFLSQKTLQLINFCSRLPVAVCAPRILINKTGLEQRISQNENDLFLLRIFAFLKNLFSYLKLALLHFLHLSLPHTSVLLSYNWPVALYVFRAAVPNLFGTRDWFHGKKNFPWTRVGVGRWFQDDSNTYIYCALYFYYYCISCTSYLQALDAGDWGPRIKVYNVILYM